MTNTDRAGGHSQALPARLFGREARRAGIGDDVLDAKVGRLARAVAETILDRDYTEFNFASSEPLGPLGDALDALRLEHRNCPYWPNGGSAKCYVPTSEGREYDIDIDTLSEILGDRLELLLDFVSIYVQMYDTHDHAELAERWYRQPLPPEATDNGERRERLRQALNSVLVPAGYRVLRSGLVLPNAMDGSAPLLDRPVNALLDGAGWQPVGDKIDAAWREIEDEQYEDAVTDIGVALEIALRLAGYPGQTLGDQIGAARRGQAFSRTNTPLGLGVEHVARWVSATRNSKGDAHDSPLTPTRAEAELALRLVLAVSGWLAEEATSTSGDSNDRDDR